MQQLCFCFADSFTSGVCIVVKNDSLVAQTILPFFLASWKAQKHYKSACRTLEAQEVAAALIYTLTLFQLGAQLSALC